MLNKKSILIAALSLLMVLSVYSGLIFGIGDSCLRIDAIGCMKIGDSCLLYCKITIDESYRLRGDVPIIVVKERGDGTPVMIEEMEYIGSIGNLCDEYECNPEIPCDTPYDVAIYINDTSGEPILIAPIVVCP